MEIKYAITRKKDAYHVYPNIEIVRPVCASVMACYCFSAVGMQILGFLPDRADAFLLLTSVLSTFFECRN